MRSILPVAPTKPKTTHWGDGDTNEENEFATRRELEESERRTNEKLDSLRRDTNKDFLHLVERMDDKFEDVRKEFESVRKAVRKEFARQNEKAEERQKSDRRFWVTTAIAIVTVAATIVGLLMQLRTFRAPRKEQLISQY